MPGERAAPNRLSTASDAGSPDRLMRSKSVRMARAAGRLGHDALILHEAFAAVEPRPVADAVERKEERRVWHAWSAGSCGAGTDSRRR